ncbi:hypothetical protein PRZ48_006172 [Zasmidium cellare]|uniref:Major facilitator superfamily (MFS) profile domain-containing protein n=1 Tax=Zasmidium cellare TaxID=395010 RepID=A0ABR0ENL8_ZASCE|nr:hypothetical protein PRZ48_006172 [Zasmidium cellare]
MSDKRSVDVDMGPAPRDDKAVAIVDDTETHSSSSNSRPSFLSSPRNLIVFYIFCYIFYTLSSLQIHIANNIGVYVTSSFSHAPLVTTAEVISWIVAGATKLPLARVLDGVGRPVGWVIIVLATTIGLILYAACTSVSTYAAATVFYWLGFQSTLYILSVFIADTSPLAWRGVLFGLLQSSDLFATFVGPAAAQSLVERSSWRWGYGGFAVAVPLAGVPVLFVLVMQGRSLREGERRDEGGLGRRVWDFVVEFDLLSLLLLTIGTVLFLLPFSLATYQSSKWRSAPVITLLVLGVVFLALFALYERYLAPKPFLPFHLLTDRTVLGCCIIIAAMQSSISCWDQNLLPYLQLAFNLNIRDAGYISSIHTLGSVLWIIATGFLIRYYSRPKWIAVLACLVQILGTGLMIAFRQKEWGVGRLHVAQVLVACSTGTLQICAEIAIMAALPPESTALALGLILLFVSFGGAIGGSIRGAIWTNTLLPKLREGLPDAVAKAVYGDLRAALRFPVGSPERAVIVESYTWSEKWMCMAATGILAVCLGAVLVWRDVDVRDVDLERAGCVDGKRVRWFVGRGLMGRRVVQESQH